MRRLALVSLTLILGGCEAQDCVIGLAHGDCGGAVAVTVFPQDDAICRSYGLKPGTRDYAKCRDAKRHVRSLTRQESDYGFLRNPLLPDLR